MAQPAEIKGDVYRREYRVSTWCQSIYRISGEHTIEMIKTFSSYVVSYLKQRGISVLLDGTVQDEKVFNLIDMSYLATASAKKKETKRDPTLPE